MFCGVRVPSFGFMTGVWAGSLGYQDLSVRLLHHATPQGDKSQGGLEQRFPGENMGALISCGFSTQLGG